MNKEKATICKKAHPENMFSGFPYEEPFDLSTWMANCPRSCHTCGWILHSDFCAKFNDSVPEDFAKSSCENWVIFNSMIPVENGVF